MNGLFEGQQGARMRSVAWWVLVMLGVFLTIEVIASVMGLRYIGAGVAAANTITVSGHGEFDAAPNMATFTFSVVSDKSTAAAAQADATQKQNAVSAYLTQQGIADKDIQTSGYNVNPQYDYTDGKQTLRGYEARQSTTVKVRDLTKAGDLLVGVGQQGATEVSGLNFTFDDPNAPQTQARQKAIADAKAKADELAKELGVSVVRVTAFNESQGSNIVRPMAAYASMGMGAADKAQAPEINPGQNTVIDDVTITYEIR